MPTAPSVDPPQSHRIQRFMFAASQLREVRVIDRRAFVRSALALIAGALVFCSSTSFAQRIDSVSVEVEKVLPGEYNGDLSKASFNGQIGNFKGYRPRLPAPTTGKFGFSVPEPSAPGSGPPTPQVAMPSPIQNFAGTSKADMCTGGICGAGWPPDTNGDVGPNHYILTVNSAVAIYSKTGTLLASFTEDNLWSGVGTSPCNGNSQGDPVVVYDWLANRWVLTWFAFGVNGLNIPISPYYQCIAASKTADPVTGGWWLYAVRMDPGTAGTPPVGNLNDYGKFALWHDCLYMGANEFSFNPMTGNATYNGVAYASFSRSDMYAGVALTSAIGFIQWNTPVNQNLNFSMFPATNNGKGAAGVQPGTPAYFVMESQTVFDFEVRKFTPGANCGGGGSLTAPVHVTQTAYTFQSGNVVPQPPVGMAAAPKLDMIDDRIMQRPQYRKIGANESIWVTHAVGTGAGGAQIAMQWAQINVTGGTISTTPVQQQIYAPDATLHRFMGSLAVDRQGNMALGYTTSNGTAPNYPGIAYSGRLAGDPLNTLPQTEVQLIAGSGSQNNTCGGNPCDRWGDYSAMTVDPIDDCTFWYTNEYYDSQANGTSGNWHTRIGSFRFPGCRSHKDSIGVFDPVTRTFYLRNSNDSGPADLAFSYGAAGDQAMKGDWDGNGITTVGVYRPSTGFFYLRNSNTPGPADISFQYGPVGPNFVPLAGDWDGNGTDTIGVYDSTSGAFFLRNSNSSGLADIMFQFGAGGAGIVPLVGDWDGNGTDTIGLYVTATGTFFLRNSNSAGAANVVFSFGPGGAGWVPIVGDWDNTGSSKIGVYNSTTGTFFLRNSNSSGPASAAFGYGPIGLTPIAGNWDALP
jgi:hypothetical protein